jgi:hypothetical protein
MARPWGTQRTGEALMRKQSEEDCLVRRITHLRTLLRYTEEAQIVVTLNEFIADTATELVTLKPDRMRKVTLH